MFRHLGIILLILLPFLITDLKNYALMAGIFIPGIGLYYYYFFLIPKTVQKSDALIRAVKLIYISVEETVLDRELRGKVIRELDEHVKILGNVMDHKLNLLRNPIILQSRPNKSKPLEQEWKKFFMQAFAVIESELEDETIRRWTFNKIRNKLNDNSGQYIKLALRDIINDSKYTHLVK